jgi:hypothetical protein
MKVQLSGKEYVSNTEGLGFKPMLSHFLISYVPPIGGGPTWRSMGVVGSTSKI